MDSKPAYKSVTLWANLVMAVAAFFIPPDVLQGEHGVMIVAAVNAVIRYFLTKQPLEGVV